MNLVSTSKKKSRCTAGQGSEDKDEGGQRRTGQGKAKLEGFVIPRAEAIQGNVREWLRVYFSIVEGLPLAKFDINNTQVNPMTRQGQRRARSRCFGAGLI
jgi:hypothetical protein